MTKTPIALFVLALAAPLAGAADGPMAHRHPAFPPDIDAFHAVLAPLWHAEPGAARDRDTCAQADTMAGLAGAIGSGDARALRAAVGALRRQCRERPGAAEPALAKVHDAFHRLIDHQGH